MPNILAIETATDTCGVALLKDGRLSASRELTQPRSHAENLVPMIAECLEEVSIRVADLDAIAVSSGPGSYTGLRIGVSTAKGLSFAADIPIVAVPTLEALAYPILQTSDQVVVPVLPSRRHEVYAAAFFREEGRTGRRMDERAMLASELFLRLAEYGVESAVVCGPGWMRVQDAGPGSPNFIFAETHASAESVVFSSLTKFESQIFEVASEFEPYYLKNFEARKAVRSIFDRLPF